MTLNLVSDSLFQHFPTAFDPEICCDCRLMILAYLPGANKYFCQCQAELETDRWRY